MPRAESNPQNEKFSQHTSASRQRKTPANKVCLREFVSPPNQFTEISSCFGLASSVFGRVMV
jgi:hypothetical protein